MPQIRYNPTTNGSTFGDPSDLFKSATDSLNNAFTGASSAFDEFRAGVVQERSDRTQAANQQIQGIKTSADKDALLAAINNAGGINNLYEGADINALQASLQGIDQNIRTEDLRIRDQGVVDRAFTKSEQNLADVPVLEKFNASLYGLTTDQLDNITTEQIAELGLNSPTEALSALNAAITRAQSKEDSAFNRAEARKNANDAQNRRDTAALNRKDQETAREEAALAKTYKKQVNNLFNTLPKNELGVVTFSDYMKEAIGLGIPRDVARAAYTTHVKNGGAQLEADKALQSFKEDERLTAAGVSAQAAGQNISELTKLRDAAGTPEEAAVFQKRINEVNQQNLTNTQILNQKLIQEGVTKTREIRDLTIAGTNELESSVPTGTLESFNRRLKATEDYVKEVSNTGRYSVEQINQLEQTLKNELKLDKRSQIQRIHRDAPIIQEEGIRKGTVDVVEFRRLTTEAGIDPLIVDKFVQEIEQRNGTTQALAKANYQEKRLEAIEDIERKGATYPELLKYIDTSFDEGGFFSNDRKTAIKYLNKARNLGVQGPAALVYLSTLTDGDGDFLDTNAEDGIAAFKAAKTKGISIKTLEDAIIILNEKKVTNQQKEALRNSIPNFNNNAASSPQFNQ